MVHDPVRLGRRIVEIRTGRGLCQDRLRIEAGISRSYLSRIEAGKLNPSIGNLEKIGAALQVGLGAFFREDGALMEADFIREIAMELPKLTLENRTSIVKRLRYIMEAMQKC